MNRIAEGWRRFPKSDRYFRIPVSFAFVALLVWVPRIYVLATEIPPFEQLQRSSGEIYFEDAARAGWRTTLKTDQGTLSFSCWTGVGSTCIFSPNLNEWQSRPATVWWFHSPNLYTGDQFAAQVEIDGVIVLSYQDSVRRLQIAKESAPVVIVIFLILPFFYWANQIRLNLKKEVTPHE
ncbi:hypothetical protein [Serpentinimonas barnesii]|uniref:hypothetical protein n=1 Tax=Serpentinimonas barnesii TaxID=1458427 RepID=UPI0011EA67B5|nr:hypothetical protein [Serpentinimonas barnesii]